MMLLVIRDHRHHLRVTWSLIDETWTIRHTIRGSRRAESTMSRDSTVVVAVLGCPMMSICQILTRVTLTIKTLEHIQMGRPRISLKAQLSRPKILQVKSIKAMGHMKNITNIWRALYIPTSLRQAVPVVLAVKTRTHMQITKMKTDSMRMGSLGPRITRQVQAQEEEDQAR